MTDIITGHCLDSEICSIVQVSYQELVQRNLSLVIAIWDEDSNSRDDYMAGVRRDAMSFESAIFIRFSFQFRAAFPPTPIPSMTKEVIVTLKHQDRDGHVSTI